MNLYAIVFFKILGTAEIKLKILAQDKMDCTVCPPQKYDKAPNAQFLI